MKEYRFTDPIYESDITYLIGGSVNELISFIKENHVNNPVMSWGESFEWGNDADTTNAYQFHINALLGYGERFYVWIHEVTPSLLYHETYHLVNDILHVRGVIFSYESEEAYSYLGGWIFQEISNSLKM